jgi:hypothetical protein
MNNPRSRTTQFLVYVKISELNNSLATKKGFLTEYYINKDYKRVNFGPGHSSGWMAALVKSGLVERKRTGKSIHYVVGPNYDSYFQKTFNK